jgi:hypothetical protein
MNILEFLLVFYFGSGLIVCTATLVMNIVAKNVTNLLGAVAQILIVFPLWPFFAHKMFFWMTHPDIIKCAWCDDVYKKDKLSIQEHIIDCKNHPMRLEMSALKEENIKLLNQLFESIDDHNN